MSIPTSAWAVANAWTFAPWKFTKSRKSEPVNSEECLGCESCVEVCETSAITVEEA